MFYLQINGGESFLTSVNSDDKSEFGKIIRDKLGRDAEDLYDTLIADESHKMDSCIKKYARRYKKCVDSLDETISAETIDTKKLQEILENLHKLYIELLEL